MSTDLKGPQWRTFKEVREKALERFYERTLAEFQHSMDPAKGAKGSASERYQRLYKLVRRRDKDLARAFDDLRRSTALYHLIAMRQLDLVTDEELARFSPETQASVRTLERQ